MIRTRGAKVNTAKWYNSGSAIVNRTVPTLYHDFANQRYYDTALGETAFPYTSVHRSTNAMQFDANGNLVWADANMIPFSESFTGGTPAWVLANGGTGLLPVRVGTSTDVPSAMPFTQSVRFTLDKGAGTTTTDFSEVYNSAPPISGAIAARSVWAKSFDGNTYTVIMGGGSPVTVTPSWQEFKITDGSTERFRIMIRGAKTPACSDTADILVTGAKVWLTGTYTNGLAEPRYISTSSLPYYAPRFDFDPVTHEPLGLLVEQSRSNDISQGFSLSGTIGTFQDGTGSNGPTYLGGWSSARYTGNGVSNPHFYFGGSVTPGASTSRSVSAIVAYVDTQYLQLATSTNWALDAANTYMNIDAIAGTITATGSAVTDTFIKKLADNVYHIGFTCVSSAAPTGGAGAIVAAINTSTAGRLPSYSHTSSFDVIYLFNGAGVGWNSITPTFGTASTRADDVVSMNTGSWLNTAAGTVYVEAKRITKSSTAQTFTNIGNSGGSTERNQFRISSGNTSHIITVGNVVQVTAAGGSAVSLNANFKAAYRYRAGEQRLVEDGTLGASLGNIPALPATQDTIHVGGLYNTSEKFNGWIKQIRYYNTASPSDAQLQTLTT